MKQEPDFIKFTELDYIIFEKLASDLTKIYKTKKEFIQYHNIDKKFDFNYISRRLTSLTLHGIIEEVKDGNDKSFAFKPTEKAKIIFERLKTIETEKNRVKKIIVTDVEQIKQGVEFENA